GSALTSLLHYTTLFRSRKWRRPRVSSASASCSARNSAYGSGGSFLVAIGAVRPPSVAEAARSRRETSIGTVGLRAASATLGGLTDRKSTRLNSSHVKIS